MCRGFGIPAHSFLYIVYTDMLNSRHLSTFLVLLFFVLVPDMSQAQSGIANGYEFVDMGLPSGTKWATCNIGAMCPEDFGSFYAWGERRTKKIFDIDTYSIFYRKIDKSISGDRSHDVARKKWGAAWRMPTKDDFEELDSLCTWTWGKRNGTDGYTVTATNGNSIFLPAAGACVKDSICGVRKEGYYWSATPNTDDANLSYYLFFNSSYAIIYDYFRVVGLTVRPVTE